MRGQARGRPFEPGQSGNPGGRPRVIGELRDLARTHAPEAVRELARLAMHAKSETPRIAAIRELLDRGFGKATQPIVADGEVVPDNLDLESLRAEILSDVARVFPDLELVPKRPALALAPFDTDTGDPGTEPT